jgi:hypothetical protein
MDKKYWSEDLLESSYLQDYRPYGRMILRLILWKKVLIMRAGLNCIKS